MSSLRKTSSLPPRNVPPIPPIPSQEQSSEGGDFGEGSAAFQFQSRLSRPNSWFTTGGYDKALWMLLQVVEANESDKYEREPEISADNGLWTHEAFTIRCLSSFSFLARTKHILKTILKSSSLRKGHIRKRHITRIAANVSGCPNGSNRFNSGKYRPQRIVRMLRANR